MHKYFNSITQGTHERDLTHLNTLKEHNNNIQPDFILLKTTITTHNLKPDYPTLVDGLDSIKL
jgi:hypothetical protein